MISALTADEQHELLTKVRELHAAMLARRSASTAPASSGARHASRAVSAATAPKHDPSDPLVKVLPRNWKGEDLRGRRFSECPSNFLGMLSHMLDAFAEQNEGDPERRRYAKWDRENAEAARRWRAKLEGKQDLFERSPATQEELDATF